MFILYTVACDKNKQIHSESAGSYKQEEVHNKIMSEG